MKKILFATTALIATGSVAAAEVTFGGYGRFGLIHDEGRAGEDTYFDQRFRLTATGIAETDAGVKFEGRIRFQTDENDDGEGQVANRSAVGFAITSGGLRVDLGHVSDVVDSGDVINFYGYGVGFADTFEVADGHLNGIASGFGTGDDDSAVAPTAKVRYSMGAFTAAASYTDDANNTGDEEYQIGFGYGFGNYNAGIAFGSVDSATAGVDDQDFVALGLDGEIGAVGFTLLVTDIDAPGFDTGFGASFKYDLSASTELRVVLSDSGADTDGETYAIGFKHNLGGGVYLAGGFGEELGDETADLGVRFDF